MRQSAITKLFSGPYLFHLLVWLVYGIYHLMRMQGYIEAKGWLFALPPFLISLSLVAVLIYVNAFILVPRLLDKKKTGWYILAVLMLALLCTYARSLAQHYWDSEAWPLQAAPISAYFKWDLFDSFWSLLISTLLLFSLRWTEQRQRIKNIEIAQLETELKYLRSQLNPHFLFNGLNTIYGNIDKGNQAARNILLQFADLLRYNLYEADVDWVELGKEADYLENYVALQRARSNANLAIDLNISINDRHIKIAPLLFIQLVENAFKFSTRDDTSRNFVKIDLQQKENEVRFSCSNSYDASEESAGGIGLANVKRRLDLLYPGRYTIEVQKDNPIYFIKLLIQL